MSRSVAVVGSGVSGLTAAHLLQRRADVTLFESDDRIGGHAHTHEVDDPSGQMMRVDTGFIVHNERTYPTLLRLFAELGVKTQDSDMSMSVRCGGCGLEYAGARGMSGLFPTRANLARPRYLAMLAEVTRFHRRARRHLAETVTGQAADQPLRDFLAAGRFSRYFVAHFMTPVVSAVWSCSPELAGDYPARYLFAFLDNHGMLSVTGSPTWRTVVGGSGTYVELAAKSLTAVQTATPVRAVVRHADGVDVHTEADEVSRFDAVVLATHPDQALAIRGVDATALERAVLGAFEYSQNPTLLHTDTAVLPRAPKAQAAWNYFLPDCRTDAAHVHVTYDMNRLQRLDSDTRYLVTLNDDPDGTGGSIDPARVVDRMDYAHPIFTPASVAAQRRLPDLSDDRIAYAGAYHGWGFHEDGARSGVDAAAHLGVTW